jgi:hypothetical protein
MLAGGALETGIWLTRRALRAGTVAAFGAHSSHSNEPRQGVNRSRDVPMLYRSETDVVTHNMMSETQRHAAAFGAVPHAPSERP